MTRYCSINSGAGGTDAQDWAEMLLRMYTRWAERRGFDVELDEKQPGQEAGISSATFTIKGRYAHGLLTGEKGVHRLGAIVAVRLAEPPADRVRERLRRGPCLDPAEVPEIDPTDLRVDTYRSSGAGVST